jgi:hypothetical protein
MGRLGRRETVGAIAPQEIIELSNEFVRNVGCCFRRGYSSLVEGMLPRLPGAGVVACCEDILVSRKACRTVINAIPVLQIK